MTVAPRAAGGGALRVEAIAQAVADAVQPADDGLGIQGPLECSLVGIRAAGAHAEAGCGIGDDRHIITSAAAAVSIPKSVVAPAEDNRQDDHGPQALIAKKAAAVAVVAAVVVGLASQEAGQKFVSAHKKTPFQILQSGAVRSPGDADRERF